MKKNYSLQKTLELNILFEVRFIINNHNSVRVLLPEKNRTFCQKIYKIKYHNVKKFSSLIKLYQAFFRRQFDDGIHLKAQQYSSKN